MGRYVNGSMSGMEEIHLSIKHTAIKVDQLANSPVLTPLGLAHQQPLNKSNSTLLPRQSVAPAIPSVEDGEEHGQALTFMTPGPAPPPVIVDSKG